MNLFLLVPPRGGSNLLYDIICTSKSVEHMDYDEGEKYFADMPTYLNAWAPVSCVHGFASRNINFYRSDRYDWDRIKEVWGEAWNIKNSGRPIFIEKSPPNIFRYDILAREFPDSKFIGMLRNPYCQIESWSRHFGGCSRGNALHDYYVDWVRHGEWLLKAKKDLGDKLLLIAYEDLVSNTAATMHQIYTFLPLLKDMWLPYKMKERNASAIQRYTYVDINDINDAILDRTMFTIERISKERSLVLLELFRYDIWREDDLGDTDCHLFFTTKYAPNVKNDRFFEYFKVMEDGLIHEPIPEWMENLGLAYKYYQPMFYRRKYLC